VFSRGILQVPKHALYVLLKEMTSMWANNTKLKKASKKWHRKALMVDLRRTTLVIERGSVNSDHVPPRIHTRQLNIPAQEFLVTATQDANCTARVQVDNWAGGFRC
jgi:hypothetical protein